MITFMRFDATGRYTATVSCPQECMPHEDDQRIFIGKVDAATHYHDLSTGMPVVMPPKPSKFNRFDYTTKQWIDPRTNETQWAVVRNERSRLLLASDWTQMPDAPEGNKAAWATYRQVLRDITQQVDPFHINWPSIAN